MIDLFKDLGDQQEAQDNLKQHDQKGQYYRRTAPPGSMISRIALHSMVFGNARAVSELWRRFVGVLRNDFWEEGRPLPRMTCPGVATATAAAPGPTASPGTTLSPDITQYPTEAAGGDSSRIRDDGLSVSPFAGGDEPPAPDLDCCLIHQKLQMLQLHHHRQQR